MGAVKKKPAPKGKPKKRARPLSFTQALADSICEQIAESVPLRMILRKSNMPARSAVYSWLDEHASFKDQYTRARERSADADADEIAIVARKVLSGKIDPQAARVGIDALKWAAGKRKPGVYGDRLDVRSTSTIYVKPDASMTPEEAAEAYRAMLRPA